MWQLPGDHVLAIFSHGILISVIVVLDLLLGLVQRKNKLIFSTSCHEILILRTDLSIRTDPISSESLVLRIFRERATRARSCCISLSFTVLEEWRVFVGFGHDTIFRHIKLEILIFFWSLSIALLAILTIKAFDLLGRGVVEHQGG